jgi:hypothetical protein
MSGQQEPSKPNSGPNPETQATSPTQPCSSPATSCTITSQTIATSPSNRARTKIGVGEEVNLTVNPGPATWAITSGSGTLNPNSGSNTNVTFTAGDTAGSVTITATGAGCSCTITFTIVEPSNWTMKRKVGSNLGHTNGRPNCSWFGTMKIHPNDVNFYRVETRELNSTISSLTGSYNIPSWVGLKHQGPSQTASAFFVITSHSDAEGSEVAMADNIDTGDPGPGATGAAPPFTPGTHFFPITWQWRVLGSGTIHNFPDQRQEAEIFANGRCESRKGGNIEHTLFSNPTSTR